MNWAAYSNSEESLSPSEAVFHTIFEHSSDGIFIVEVEAVCEGKSERFEFRYLNSNPAHAWMMAIATATIAGSRPHDCLPTELADQVCQTYRRCVEQRQSFSQELVFERNGQRHNLVTNLSPLFEPDGRISKLIGLCQNLTDRQQTEATLRQSEARYRAVVENQTELISRSLPDGTLTFVNEAYCLYFGQQREDLLGLNFMLLVPESEWQQIKHDLAALTPENPILITEHQELNGDSETRWLQWVDQAIFDQQGQVIEIQSVGRDVTDRKQTEARLQQQAERDRLMTGMAQRIRQSLQLEEILSTTVEEVRHFLQTDRVILYRFHADDQGVIMAESIADGWTSMLGLTLAETLGENHHQSLSRGEIVVVDNIYAAGIEPPHPDRLARFQVQANLVVPISPDGQLWGLLIAHHCSGPRHWQPLETDFLTFLATQVALAIQQSQLYQKLSELNTTLEAQVQERTAQLQQALDFEAVLKRITDKVRDSLDENQILQTVVRELTLTVDVDCCDTGLYDFERNTVLINQEHAQVDWPSGQGQELPAAAIADAHAELLKGRCLQFCELEPPCNQPRSAVLACPIIDDQGILGDLWLFRPTERTFNELEIRLTQQVANQCAIAIRQARLYQSAQEQVAALEKLHQLKDDFLSTVSHELRTPLANIKMAIHLLKTSPLSDRTDHYLQILHEECTRETELINDLLDLQRLEAGVSAMTLEILQVPDWLPGVIEPFRARAHERQQTLQVQCLLPLPPLMSDRYALERVLAELLNNACKYTPPGGEIGVTVQHLPGPSSPLLFQVGNSAEIPSSELPRIFDKFYRVPQADPWLQGGTGLGLALVQKLVEQLKGEIQVESRAGQTLFSLRLPQHRSNPALSSERP